MNHHLEIRSLTKAYGATMALRDVNLSVRSGQTLALLGPNGAGKSTLFGCLLGFTRPTSGEIRWNARILCDDSRALFGYTAERVALYPHRTVAENAVFFAALKGLSAAEAERQIERVGLRIFRTRKVRQLSKGMLQRLGLAIALCGQPHLLILDEPFNGLDPALLEILQTILLEERARGAALLISTHTMSAIEQIATHVAVLLHGRLAVCQTVESLRAEFGHHESLESIYHKIALRDQTLEEALA